MSNIPLDLSAARISHTVLLRILLTNYAGKPPARAADRPHTTTAGPREGRLSPGSTAGEVDYAAAAAFRLLCYLAPRRSQLVTPFLCGARESRHCCATCRSIERFYPNLTERSPRCSTLTDRVHNKQRATLVFPNATLAPSSDRYVSRPPAMAKALIRTVPAARLNIAIAPNSRFDTAGCVPPLAGA